MCTLVFLFFRSEEMLTSIVNEANATGLLRSKVYAGPAHEAEGGLLDDVRTSTQVGRSMAWMVVAGRGTRR